MSFLDFRLLDLIDILLVAVLLYQLYRLVKGTVAINIFVGITTIYLIWKLVDALQMELLSEILGQFIGVGVIALIIVFQQELRKFLLVIGTTGFSNRRKILQRIKWFKVQQKEKTNVRTLVDACTSMATSKTGAIIAVTRKSELGFYAQTGDRLDAQLSTRMLESIFYKNSPLHDGAVILSGNRITAARAILPVSDQTDLPAHLGMRHRAALGLTEKTDAVAIVVSEQTGTISYAKEGKITMKIPSAELEQLLERDLE